MWNIQKDRLWIVKETCKPPELHTIMKECNGTGLVLKRYETKKMCGKGVNYQYKIV